MRSLFPLRSIWASLIPLILISCREEKPPFPLEGSWNASSLIVSDSLWDVETTPVSLQLESRGRYHLQWFGNRSETGRFHINYPSLFIRPEGEGERTMRILFVDQDSLALQGIVDEKKTVLSFRKHDGLLQ